MEDRSTPRDFASNPRYTVDRLTRAWTLVQRRKGHRHSTDDLLTAWYACEVRPGATRVLDLGSGIGSVGLLVLWRSPAAALTAVEAQDESFVLLTENARRNGLGARVRAVHGDLRTTRFPGEAFELVTGSPPYFDPRAGIVPADSQKAHARFELRGDVRDYCVAAKAALGEGGGRFVFCFPSAQRARAEQAAAAAGLSLLATRDVVPREGAPALFTLFACCASGSPDARDGVEREPPHVVRDREGRETATHARARATFGMP